jgi:uncharacterized membrane protein YraQ (UPF0718 family)
VAGRKRIIDGQLLFMLLILAVLGALAWWRGGPALLGGGLRSGGELVARYAALIAVSFLAAGLAQALLPTAWVEGALGRDAGLRGILIGTAAGAMTPAGPFVSLPIAAVLLQAGAATPSVVAYVTAWSLLAVHRLVAWEVPILGLRFALLRYVVCLALPVLAGLGARALARAD